MRSKTTGPASSGVRSPLPIANAAPGPLGLYSTDSRGYAYTQRGRLTGGDAERALGFGRLDGVPAEEPSRAPDEFHRPSTARTSGVPGTGLGLMIAQTIAREHGGSVTPSGGAGKGTTATLRLPTAA